MLGTRDGGRGSGIRGRKSGKDSSQGTGVSDQEKTEVRSQRSKVRGQKSEVKSQKSEVRGRPSEMRCAVTDVPQLNNSNNEVSRGKEGVRLRAEIRGQRSPQ